MMLGGLGVLNALSCSSSFFFFFKPILQIMEVPRLGVELELQLQAYAIATAIPYPSHIFDLCQRLQQCQIPLSKGRDQTHILMDTMLGS